MLMNVKICQLKININNTYMKNIIQTNVYINAMINII